MFLECHDTVWERILRIEGPLSDGQWNVTIFPWGMEWEPIQVEVFASLEHVAVFIGRPELIDRELSWADFIRLVKKRGFVVRPTRPD
jgi:hypothetical protein